MEVWEPKYRIEREFHHNLMEIAKQIIVSTGNVTDPDELSHILMALASSPEFLRFAESAAVKMVTHLFDDQGHTWRQAAAANGRGRVIYEALQAELRGYTGRLLMEQIRQNAEIIKTLPIEVAVDVTSYVSRETLKGRRASDIADEIVSMFPEHTRARANLIARTEVSKTQCNLLESRCRQFGIPWYVWRAVGGPGGDGRTRKSHRGMSGTLVHWDDPPAPEDLFPTIGRSGRRYRNTLGHYHAGCCPNCRCYAEPVIEPDMLQWPMKLYQNGAIRRISRQRFLQINS